MSDPKPYTTQDADGLSIDGINWDRFRATVEALERAERERDAAQSLLARVMGPDVDALASMALMLERAERERDASRNALAEHREDADRCIAAETKRRVEAERERDEALAKPRTVAEHLMSSYERVLLRRAEKAERERDEETRKRYAAEAAHDLMAREKERAEHAHNALLLTVGPLKAALRDVALQGTLARPCWCLEGRDAADDDVDGHAVYCFRAREALGEGT